MKTKKIQNVRAIAFLAFTLFAVSTFAQNSIQNVFVKRNIVENQVSVEVLIAGPGRQGGHLTVVEDYQITSSDNYQITSVDVTFFAPISTKDELDVNLSMKPSSGARWSSSVKGSNDTGIFDQGIVTIRQANGKVTRWKILFNLGTGTRTTTGQANNKAELL